MGEKLLEGFAAHLVELLDSLSTGKTWTKRIKTKEKTETTFRKITRNRITKNRDTKVKHVHGHLLFLYSPLDSSSFHFPLHQPSFEVRQTGIQSMTWPLTHCVFVYCWVRAVQSYFLNIYFFLVLREKYINIYFSIYVCNIYVYNIYVCIKKIDLPKHKNVYIYVYII